MLRHHPASCLQPSCFPRPSRPQPPLVSRFRALKGVGVGLEDSADPVRIVAKFAQSFDRKRYSLTVLILDAVPSGKYCLQQVELAFLAELKELVAAQSFENCVERGGFKCAAVCRFLNAYGPLEGFYLFANERHKAE